MPKKSLPEFIPPMMANSAKEPFDSPDWIFEIKLDGYRAITVFDAAGKPHLWSRNGLPLEAKFPAIANAVFKLELHSTVLDGEVVAVDKDGIPRFQLLQRFQKQSIAPTLYMSSISCGTTAMTLRESPSKNQKRARTRLEARSRCSAW
jgi:bifunctional non-homologous end joining protein LigD